MIIKGEMGHLKRSCCGLLPGPETKPIIQLLSSLKIEIDMVILRKGIIFHIIRGIERYKPDLLMTLGYT